MASPFKTFIILKILFIFTSFVAVVVIWNGWMLPSLQLIDSVPDLSCQEYSHKLFFFFFLLVKSAKRHSTSAEQKGVGCQHGEVQEVCSSEKMESKCFSLILSPNSYTNFNSSFPDKYPPTPRSLQVCHEPSDFPPAAASLVVFLVFYFGSSQQLCWDAGILVSVVVLAAVLSLAASGSTWLWVYLFISSCVKLTPKHDKSREFIQVRCQVYDILHHILKR